MEEMLPNDLQGLDKAYEFFKAFSLCPLDGRYSEIMEKCAPYFSEFALVQSRVQVEVMWLIFLLDHVESDILNSFDQKRQADILKIYTEFDLIGYQQVKAIEEKTKHDVKAVELYVADKLKEIGCDSLVSYVHIGCTSEDITNNAYAINMRDFMEEIWIPQANLLLDKLTDWAITFCDVPMLAHTHGQPATPTTVGKEILIFCYRLNRIMQKIRSMNFYGKFNGATGNYAAILLAFPNENWPVLAKEFVQQYLGLSFNPVTTQIESHDYICELLDEIRHFGNIVSNLDLDMWLYISMDYFKQKVVASEVGSSTMPHKVNPIKFENSEANVSVSNGLCYTLSEKLSKSRMQRDLSDSSALRNIGIALGYSLLATESTISGLKRAQVNEVQIHQELEEKWEVLAEPIQTMLRKYGVPDAYNQLKALTRGKNISKEAIQDFVQSLTMLSKEDQEMLLALTPMTYIGLASKIVEDNI